MDTYYGSATGQWSFDNGAFTEAMEGGTMVIAGSPEPLLNGTFTIDSVDSSTLVTMSPVPAVVPPTAVDATSITRTYTPAVQFNAGPQIVGVTVIPEVKDGANKLGSDRRAT
jgi:hypothetical protein